VTSRQTSGIDLKFPNSETFASFEVEASTTKKMMMLLSPWIIILLSAPFCSAVRKLIVNGEDAVRGRYPYFVTLQKPGAVNSYGAGALIAPDIILTAGHTKPRERDHVMPHVGTFSFDDDADFEEFEIVEMVRHPEFLRKGDDEFIHDFTILKLNRLSDAPVVKINRNNQVPFEGQAIEVMGLGTLTADDDARPNVLQQATLNYISNDECRQQTDPERGITFNGRIEDSHLCTYTPPNNSRDACNFDSGGPLILPNYEKGHDLLVALVSWGLGKNQFCTGPLDVGAFLLIHMIVFASKVV
jgi:secreted trypsin-like serine protease